MTFSCDGGEQGPGRYGAGRSGFTTSGAASCKSTDKSVCATPTLPPTRFEQVRQDRVAQTLLSVLVMLGTTAQKDASHRSRQQIPHSPHRVGCAADVELIARLNDYIRRHRHERTLPLDRVQRAALLPQRHIAQRASGSRRESLHAPVLVARTRHVAEETG